MVSRENDERSPKGRPSKRTDPDPARARDAPGSGDPDLAGMLDAVTGLISLQIARSRLALQRAGLWLAVGVVASIAVSTLTVVSVWLLVDGLAHGGRALLADAPWLGTALAGAVGLGSLALALRFGFGRVERRVLERLLRQADAEDSKVASQRAERPS